MEDKEHQCINYSRIEAVIQQHGHYVAIIEATDYLPSFAYSIGLWTSYNHPEIICFGLKNDTLHWLINDVAELIREGQRMKPGNTYDTILKTLKTEFLKVDKRNLSDYFGAAINYYKTDAFPALQLIWPDRNNLFPWQEGFEDSLLFKQPLLDRNADFKFNEPRNVATFSSRQWIELKEPIISVIHYDDGSWMFLTGEERLEDLEIVALEQLVLRDNTLNDLFNLGYGEQASREFIGGEWVRSKYEEPEEEDEEE